MTEASAYRRSFLLRLKDCSQRLIPLLHSASDVLLDQNVTAANDLCSTIEQCLFYGMVSNGADVITDHQIENTFFGFIQLLDSYTSPSHPLLHNSVLKIASNNSLHTPLGKARGWIRETLNSKTLDQILQISSKHPKLVATFYKSDSILMASDDLSILLAVTQSLRVLPFKFTVDDTACNTVPLWLLNLSHVLPMSPRTGSQAALSSRASSSINNSSSDRRTGSFFSGVGSLFDSASNMFSRFIESGGSTSPSDPSVLPLFETPLRTLVLHESRCIYATLDPLLGIPTQVHRLLSFIERHPQTPGLFRHQPSSAAFDEMRQCCINADVDFTIPGVCSQPPNVHTAVALLCEFLHLLPEPLLGIDRYAALRDVQKMEEHGQRVKNVRCLVDQAPWYSAPLLVRLFALFSNLLLPINAEKNGLSLTALSVLFTPFLIRNAPCLPKADSRDFNQIMMRTAAAGVVLVHFVIENEGEIFAEKREFLSQRQSRLSSKCTAIKSLQTKLIAVIRGTEAAVAVDAPEVYQRDRLAAIQALWVALGAAHRMRYLSEKSIPANVLETFDVLPSDDSLLLSSRWRHCGFPFPTAGARTVENAKNPLYNLSNYAIRMIEGFATKYAPKSSKAILCFAQDRAKYGNSLAKTTNVVIKACALELGLLEERGGDIVAPPMPRLSRLTCWELFSFHSEQVEDVFQQVCFLALLSYDDFYLTMTVRSKRMPSLETGASALNSTMLLLRSVLANEPKNVNSLWEMWAESRVRGQVEAAEGRSASVGNQPHYFGSSMDEDDEEDDEDDCEQNEKVMLDLRTLRDPKTSPKIIKKTSVFDLSSSVIGESKILTRGECTELEKAAPPYFQVRDWRLLFAIDLNGANLGSLLKSCEGARATLIIVRERGEHGATFGGLIPCPMKDQDDFYGDSSAMVFTFLNGIIDVWNGGDGNNEMYVFSHKNKGIGFGNGGRFAFWIDSELNKGTSGESETYQNDLLSHTSDFGVADLEAYGLT